MIKRLILMAVASTISVLVLVVLTASAQIPNTKTISLSSGTDFCLAVNTDGMVYAWGLNSNAQIDATKGELALRPAVIKELDGIISVTAGFNSFIAIAQNGDVLVSGGDSGIRRVTGFSKPVKGAVSIDKYYMLTGDGDVYAWDDENSPSRLNLPCVLDVAAGNSHCLFLTVTGKVYAIGENFLGQLGDGAIRNTSAPLEIKGLSDIINIGAGSNHSFAITRTGEVYAWGQNSNGQLGLGVTSEQIRTPQIVNGLEGVIQIDGGDTHSVALDKNGRIYTWGNGSRGQLGVVAVTSRNVPKSVADITKADAVAAGGNSTYVKIENKIKGFGKNDNAQIGGSGSNDIQKAIDIIGNIRKETPFSIDFLEEASGWAKDDIKALYDSAALPLSVLHDFKSNITRAEFAALLVEAYDYSKAKKAPVSAESPFKDISGNEYEIQIKKALELGVIDGVSADTFEPDATLTREQAAKMLSIVYGAIKDTKIPVFNYSKFVFADSKNVSSWADPYVSFAIERRIMQGVSESEFLPKGNLTREAAIVTVKRIILR